MYDLGNVIVMVIKVWPERSFWTIFIYLFYLGQTLDTMAMCSLHQASIFIAFIAFYLVLLSYSHLCNIRKLHGIPFQFQLLTEIHTFPSMEKLTSPPSTSTPVPLFCTFNIPSSLVFSIFFIFFPGWIAIGFKFLYECCHYSRASHKCN